MLELISVRSDGFVYLLHMGNVCDCTHPEDGAAQENSNTETNPANTDALVRILLAQHKRDERRDEHQKQQDERQDALNREMMTQLSRMTEEKPHKEHFTKTPLKLRLENIPKWPPKAGISTSYGLLVRRMQNSSAIYRRRLCRQALPKSMKIYRNQRTSMRVY